MLPYLLLIGILLFILALAAFSDRIVFGKAEKRKAKREDHELEKQIGFLRTAGVVFDERRMRREWASEKERRRAFLLERLGVQSNPYPLLEDEHYWYFYTADGKHWDRQKKIPGVSRPRVHLE